MAISQRHSSIHLSVDDFPLFHNNLKKVYFWCQLAVISLLSKFFICDGVILFESANETYRNFEPPEADLWPSRGTLKNHIEWSVDPSEGVLPVHLFTVLFVCFKRFPSALYSCIKLWRHLSLNVVASIMLFGILWDWFSSCEFPSSSSPTPPPPRLSLPIYFIHPFVVCCSRYLHNQLSCDHRRCLCYCALEMNFNWLLESFGSLNVCLMVQMCEHVNEVLNDPWAVFAEPLERNPSDSSLTDNNVAPTLEQLWSSRRRISDGKWRWLCDVCDVLDAGYDCELGESLGSFVVKFRYAYCLISIFPV